MRLFLNVFGLAAQYGRVGLPITLLFGVLFQDQAKAVLPYVSIMVFVVLALAAFRVGPRQLREGLRSPASSLVFVVILQMALPMSLACLLLILGLAASPAAISVVLATAAPALIGSSTIAALMKADPEPAFRTMAIGHVILPVTMLPLFLILPELGDPGEAIFSSGQLFLFLLPAAVLGLITRSLFVPELRAPQAKAVDGLATLVLMLLVFGLMGALGPLMRAAPHEILFLLGLSFAVNFGLQITIFALLKASRPKAEAVSLAIASGNRNVSLFIIALPPELLSFFLVFLGTYQVPMFLTPLAMRRVYAMDRSPSDAAKEPSVK
ncbi:MAG: hypothetical protein AAGF94_00615 [Pseudomonadota bacterium]